MTTHICFHVDHDSCAAIVENGNLIYHIAEERFAHIKNATYPVLLNNQLNKLGIVADYSSYSTLDLERQSALDVLHITHKRMGICDTDVLITHYSHHILHAMCAFIRSGMDEATTIVIDGAGSFYDYGKEHLSVLKCWYVNDVPHFKFLHQKVIGNGDFVDVRKSPDFVDQYKCIGPGFCYAAVACALGWGSLECGKVMGLAPYGEYDESIPELINLDTSGNLDVFALEELFTEKEGAQGAVAYYLQKLLSEKPKEEIDSLRKNISWRIQDDFEKYIINFFNKVIESIPSKNIVYTGGCALNCVANNKLLKSLPEDINLYVEPISSDAGCSIGGVINSVMSNGEPILPSAFKGIYFGSPLEYNYTLNNGETERYVSVKEVANLLTEGNIVAIAQGQSESGPRALGNRSILFDPRVPDGKSIVNRVKKREPWRPFAGTILKEHAKEWFDMHRLDETPYMMYALDVIPEKKDKIPSIIHVDGTCRIQTVTKEQNKNYYQLIKEFYSLTDVPILFNTSFNLAGDTIVETIEDAFNTLRNSEIEYLYLPEIEKLIHVPNK